MLTLLSTARLRKTSGFLLAALACLAAAVLPLPASATSVYLIAVGVRDAEVLLDGRKRCTLRVGETSAEGVRLRDIDNGNALLEVNGHAIALRPGQSAGSQVTLVADDRGQFIAWAYINGLPVRALVDSGATYVTLDAPQATRMGIDYARGQRSVSMTANGPVPAYVVNLAYVQVGDIGITNVPGLVIAGGASGRIPVLIGISFLRRLQIRQNGDTMVLLQDQ